MKKSKFLKNLSERLLSDRQKYYKWASYILFASIGLFFLILVISSFFVYRVSTNQDLIRKKALVNLAAELIYQKLTTIEQIGTSLAENEKLSEMISAGDWQGALSSIGNIPEKVPLIDRIFLANPQATIMADQPHLEKAVGTSHAETDWYKGVSKSWQPYLSEVFKRPSIPRINVVDFAIPIRPHTPNVNPASGQVLGILVLQIELDSLSEWIQDVKLDSGEFLYVVDNKGHIAYHPGFPPQGEIIDFSSVPSVQKISRGQKGAEIIYNPIENVARFTVYQGVKRFGWGVALPQSLTSAFVGRTKPLTTILFVYGFFLLAISLLAGTILWFINQHQKHFIELQRALDEASSSRESLVSLLDENNHIREALEAKLEELKTTQAMLVQSGKLAALGKLVADMAHEVNNPLMIISGNAQLCLLEAIQNKEVENNLKVIVQESERAKDIIRRLLTFSQPSKGEIHEIDINSCIEAIVTLLENQFNLSHVQLQRHYAERLPHISADEKQLQEVFMNLLNNSRDAMPQGGVISITTSKEGSYVKLDFKDTGCGMTEEVKSNLFEPFFTTKEKGTGLGLSVCYGIIKAHDGRIRFESKPGAGTIATIMLPIGE